MSVAQDGMEAYWGLMQPATPWYVALKVKDLDEDLVRLRLRLYRVRRRMGKMGKYLRRLKSAHETLTMLLQERESE